MAMGLIRHVLEAAGQHHATRVEEVEVEVGAMQQVAPEALEAAFEAVSANTIAAGAVLKIVETPLRAVCRHCGHEFAPTIDNFLCPGCRQADVDILGGNDILLKSVTCETEQGASSE